MSSRRLAILCCWIVISSCSRSDSTTDRTAEAARADSSAAGYAVGDDSTRASVSGPRPAIGDTTPTAIRDTATRAKASAKPHVDSAAALRRIAAARIDAVRRLDSAARSPQTDSVKRPPLPLGLTHVNEFLSYDAQNRTATLMLTAGYNGLNDALNYNGGARGSQGVSVPRGWTIHVSVTNRDSDLQHSAIVVRQMLPPPEEMPAPAFAGASLPQLEEGVHEGDTASFEFVAERAGQFMIACGVPGHAQGGMWLRLTISGDIDRPAYR